MRLAEQVAQRLQEWIGQGQWQPGQRLPAERALAQQLGVSRPSLREAIGLLASQGILSTRRGDGTYVQAPSNAFLLPGQIEPKAPILSDPEYSFDVMEARAALESSTAWLAAQRATTVDKERIRRCFDAMVRHQQSGQSLLSAQADVQFHLAIAEASHNVVLLRVMHSLFELLSSTVLQSRRAIFAMSEAQTAEALTQQHYALMQAIIEGDADGARQAIEQHLGYVRDSVHQLHGKARTLQPQPA
ncbi:FCD domain-containing protein [Allofranklinella schreckenbergeri]|uniref:FCD domain-containing protein n=1 Tax=Allofranklinella schreckenbergeri TaxID=1076744 RepID=A0A3M6R910_9BURK|nr:FCD domain-containing protein [Allofranklinella schreckenbergeri]RMX11734.1 FCD domain-containing protein [Allofranklinella schreckenbergeri]